MPRVTTERVPMVVRYRVQGSLPFPIDMLRYDAAWPASETDSNIITSTHQYENKGLVQVEVRSRRPPTPGRWESFGWLVLPGLSSCWGTPHEP